MGAVCKLLPNLTLHHQAPKSYNVTQLLSYSSQVGGVFMVIFNFHSSRNTSECSFTLSVHLYHLWQTCPQFETLVWQVWRRKERRKKEPKMLWNAGRRKDCKNKLVLATWPKALPEPRGRSSTGRESAEQSPWSTADWWGKPPSLLLHGRRRHQRIMRDSSQESPWWGTHQVPDWLIQVCHWPFKEEKIEAYFTNGSLLFPWLEVTTKYDSAEKLFLLLLKLQCWVSLWEL